MSLFTSTPFPVANNSTNRNQPPQGLSTNFDGYKFGENNSNWEFRAPQYVSFHNPLPEPSKFFENTIVGLQSPDKDVQAPRPINPIQKKLFLSPGMTPIPRKPVQSSNYNKSIHNGSILEDDIEMRLSAPLSSVIPGFYPGFSIKYKQSGTNKEEKEAANLAETLRIGEAESTYQIQSQLNALVKQECTSPNKKNEDLRKVTRKKVEVWKQKPFQVSLPKRSLPIPQSPKFHTAERARQRQIFNQKVKEKEALALKQKRSLDDPYLPKFQKRPRFH